MARCVVGKGQHSLHRSDAANTIERCVWSMRPALLIVARVPYSHRVKDTATPPKNLAESVRSCIHCLMKHQKSRPLRAFLPLPLTPSCGVIGHVASRAAPG